MRLYHGTKKSLLERIEITGLESIESEKISNDERLNLEAVYGFDNIEDAEDFMCFDNNSCDDFMVLSFEAEDAIIDTEYDGNAFAVLRDVPFSELTIVSESE